MTTLLALMATAVHAEPRSAELKRAVELFELSAISYREGRFDDAARLLREAYRLNPAPTLQYNLARALEGMGELRGAIEAYQRFLAGSPAVDDRPAIERRVATLTRQLAEKEALEREREAAQRERAAAEALLQAGRAGAEAPRASASSSSLSSARRAAPWVLFGTGAATLVAGGALGGLVLAQKDEAAALPIARDADERLVAAERYALGANLCFGIGGALALAGGIWGIVDLVRHRSQPESRR